jgi:hypothetical protein
MGNLVAITVSVQRYARKSANLSTSPPAIPTRAPSLLTRPEPPTWRHIRVFRGVLTPICLHVGVQAGGEKSG